MFSGMPTNYCPSQELLFASVVNKDVCFWNCRWIWTVWMPCRLIFVRKFNKPTLVRETKRLRKTVPQRCPAGQRSCLLQSPPQRAPIRRENHPLEIREKALSLKFHKANLGAEKNRVLRNWISVKVRMRGCLCIRMS